MLQDLEFDAIVERRDEIADAQRRRLEAMRAVGGFRGSGEGGGGHWGILRQCGAASLTAMRVPKLPRHPADEATPALLAWNELDHRFGCVRPWFRRYSAN